MSWQLSGRFHEFCNCDLLCPCLFDVTARPDQGWCGSVFTFDIERGGSDGVDLAGRTAVIAVNIPGTFAEGNFTARLYVDDGADEPQQRALEQIFTGQQGGPWEVVAPAFAQWLPTKTAPGHGAVGRQAGDRLWRCRPARLRSPRRPERATDARGWR